MPLYREVEPPEGVRVAVWEICEETPELLSAASPGKEEQVQYGTFTHEGRKRQWLACRAALRHLLGPGADAAISYDPHGKPHLANHPGCISLTHTRRFAAAAYHPERPVGIDLEEMRDRIERVRERFLKPSDLEAIGPAFRLEQLYVHWGGREALYKLQGVPGTDFLNDIIVPPFEYLCDTPGSCPAFLISSGTRREYTLWYTKLEDHMLTVAYPH